jgi:hypothetical protein
MGQTASDRTTHMKSLYMVHVAMYLLISKSGNFSLGFVHNTSKSKRLSLKQGSVPSVGSILQNLCSSQNGSFNVPIHHHRHHHRHITKLLHYITTTTTTITTTTTTTSVNTLVIIVVYPTLLVLLHILGAKGQSPLR